MSKRFWALCLLASVTFNLAWRLLYSHAPWDLQGLGFLVLRILIMWICIGTVFKRIYEKDHGIPPSHSD